MATTGLKSLLLSYKLKIGLTWMLVVIEASLMALIPLMIGMAIDGLLDQSSQALIQLGSLLAGITVIAVTRRFYDTRAYGLIRVKLGLSQDKKQQHLATSARSARVDMAGELVDFLEDEIPELLTAIITLIVALLVLASFSYQLMIAAMVLVASMLITYFLFHGHFYRYNGALNAQTETQVTILNTRNTNDLFQHLQLLKHWRIRLSDTEALLFGLIFLMITGFIISSLYLCIQIENISAGEIFSIINYCWQFSEAAIMFPVTLQSWSRLSEITTRLNTSADQK